MATLKPDQILSTLKPGKAHAYLFDGPETWLKEKWLSKLEPQLITPEEKELNFSRFHGKDASPAEIVNTAQSLPFLSKRRLIFVMGTEDFKASDQKIIAEGLSNLPASTSIFFLYRGKALLREPIPAQISSMGYLVTFWPPFENQLPGWIQSETKSRGKSITWDAAKTLADSCQNLKEISNEVDKLILSIGNKPQITIKDLEFHGLPDAVGELFDLDLAVWEKNMPECLRQGELLSDLGVRGEIIFSLLARIFRNILLAHFLIKEKKLGIKDIQQVLKIRGITQERKLNSGLRAYNFEESSLALKKIAQADYELKTGILPSRLAVSLLLLQLLGGQKGKKLAFGY